MVKIKLYTKTYCPYCRAALRILDYLKIEYDNVDVMENYEEYKDLANKNNHLTVPLIFIGEEFIGGYDELDFLYESGDLNKKYSFKY